MTLKHLRIFVTVYREMNITKAADLLHMTQPAVSRSIQELKLGIAPDLPYIFQVYCIKDVHAEELILNGLPR